jgi:hypothetical protein
VAYIEQGLAWIFQAIFGRRPSSCWRWHFSGKRAGLENGPSTVYPRFSLLELAARQRPPSPLECVYPCGGFQQSSRAFA